MPVAGLSSVESARFAIEVENPGRYRAVDTSDDALPLHFNGTLLSTSQMGGESVLAVGVNGEIVAVTRTYDADGRVASFWAMIPPDKLIDGANEITVFHVEGTGSERVLEVVPLTNAQG